MAEKHQQGGDISHWSLDKRIPIALIVTVIMSTGVGVSAAAVAHYRVAMLEKQVERLETSGRDVIARDRVVSERLVELTSATQNLREAVSEFRQSFREMGNRIQQQDRERTYQPPAGPR